MKRFLREQTNEKKTQSSKKDKIVKQLREDIDEGILKRGEQIPSRMQLAERFEVDPKTVDRAVAQLIEQNILYTSPRIGTFVRSAALLNSEAFYGNYAGQFGKCKKQRRAAHYVQIGPTEVHPYFFLQHCMKRMSMVTTTLIKQSRSGWMRRAKAKETLLRLLRDNVSMREGKKYADENFMLSNGKFHTLRIIVGNIICPGDVVLAVFPDMASKRVLEELGADIWFLPRSDRGITATALIDAIKKAEKLNKNIALVYIDLQLDYAGEDIKEIEQEMRAVLAITQEKRIALIENFEDHEIIYRTMPTFADLTERLIDNVISIRTYSKLLAMYNEYRIVLAPADFIERLTHDQETGVQYGFLYDIFASMLLKANIFSQVSEAITENFRLFFRNTFQSCQENLGLWATLHSPLSGTCFWVTAQKGYELQVPIKKLRKLNLSINYTEESRTDIIATDSLLVGFGDSDSRELKEAIRLIGIETTKAYR